LLPENRFAAMEFAVGAYRMLGLSDKAQVIEKSLIEQNPRGEQAAIKRFSEILQTEDPARKIERLNGFLVDFPGTRVAETALSQLVGAAIQANDTTTLVRTADRLLEKAASQTGADALAAAAGVFADSRMELDRAFACIQKAMDLVQSGTAGKDALSTEARYRDILGWILFRKGDLTGALNELRMAERNILQATVFFHLGAVLDASGDRDGAAMYFARAAAYRGGVGDAAGARFREVWILANKDTLLAGRFLDEQARWVEEAGKRKILSKRSAWPAPDFRLEDARGGWVRLSDQKGNVVVLCVWGTWSKTSLSLLETLEEMADAYGQKVLFLTVAMDHDRSTVLRFLRQRRMILPVLINEGMENTYRIEGVPMVYVIDTKGEVLFTHRGFRPDLGRILSVELDDLLGPEPK
jgi:tetratricopeptide (TPR) repeat protein